MSPLPPSHSLHAIMFFSPISDIHSTGFVNEWQEEQLHPQPDTSNIHTQISFRQLLNPKRLGTDRATESQDVPREKYFSGRNTQTACAPVLLLFSSPCCVLAWGPLHLQTTVFSSSFPHPPHTHTHMQTLISTALGTELEFTCAQDKRLKQTHHKWFFIEMSWHFKTHLQYSSFQTGSTKTKSCNQVHIHQGDSL